MAKRTLVIFDDAMDCDTSTIADWIIDAIKECGYFELTKTDVKENGSDMISKVKIRITVEEPEEA